MKSPVLLVAVSLLALAGSVSAQQTVRLPGSIAQAQTTQNQPEWLRVAVPGLAEILLKNGSSITGRITSLGTSGVEVELSGNTANVPLSDVSKILFRRDKPVLTGSSTLPVRGDGSLDPRSGTRVWQGVPVGGFRLSGAKGQAEVNLQSFLTPAESRGVQSVSRKYPYTVEEISFSSAQAMTIRVTPTLR